MKIETMLSNEDLDQLVGFVVARVIGELRPQLDRIERVLVRERKDDLDMPKPTFIRLRELTSRIGLSRSTINKRVSDGTFPETVSLGGRSVAWRVEEVEIWEASRDAGHI